MNKCEGIATKTTIEHLIYLNQKSIVQVCKDLQITPQQFSDWIKKRRPIPAVRLNALKTYFDIDGIYLVDERKYARNMSALNKIELEILVMSNRLDQSILGEDIQGYKYTINKLKREKEQQIRIARLSAVLNTNNEKIRSIIDIVLDMLENGDLTLYDQLLRHKGGKTNVHSLQDK